MARMRGILTDYVRAPSKDGSQGLVLAGSRGLVGSTSHDRVEREREGMSCHSILWGASRGRHSWSQWSLKLAGQLWGR